MFVENEPMESMMKPYQARGVVERRHTSLMADALRKLECDVLNTVIEAEGLPEGWATIAQEAPNVGPRDRVTMRMDRDVIRFFKAMGPGYQERICNVLRAFVHGRLAKVIDGPDTTDIVLRPDAVAEKIKDVIDWGHTDEAQTELIHAMAKAEMMEEYLRARLESLKGEE
jgi:uncharacterized protein (DUF4415 family)